jgi:hypothetical protein
MHFKKKIICVSRKLTVRAEAPLWERLDAVRQWADRNAIEFDLERALAELIEQMVTRAEKQQRQNAGASSAEE